MLFYRYRRKNRIRHIRQRRQAHNQGWRHSRRQFRFRRRHPVSHRIQSWNNAHIYHHWQHFLVSLVLFVAGVLAIFYGVSFLRDEMSFYHYSYHRDNASVAAQSRLRAHRPISVLIMGADHSALGYHNHWTGEMMINTVNPRRNSMQLTSIPRGAMVNNGQTADNLNREYGPVDTQKRLQNWLHVPINYYMLLNMHGLQRVVNEVGGVKVDPPLTINFDQLHVRAHHPVRLNGRQALDYCLMVHQDPRGDYGRQLRQRQVLFQLFHQTASVYNLTRHPALARALSKQVRTNIPLSGLIQLAAHYRGSNHHLVSTSLRSRDHKRVGNHDHVQISTAEKRRRAAQINRLME